MICECIESHFIVVVCGGVCALRAVGTTIVYGSLHPHAMYMCVEKAFAHVFVCVSATTFANTYEDARARASKHEHERMSCALCKARRRNTEKNMPKRTRQMENKYEYERRHIEIATPALVHVLTHTKTETAPKILFVFYTALHTTAMWQYGEMVKWCHFYFVADSNSMSAKSATAATTIINRYMCILGVDMFCPLRIYLLFRLACLLRCSTYALSSSSHRNLPHFIWIFQCI